MYQNDAEVLFPIRVARALRDLRGEQWRQLVEHVNAHPEDHPDVLAFGLMMIRIDGCLTCHADSYRALRGCTFCAQQMLGRFKGSDEDLLQLWEIARDDVRHFFNNGHTPITG